MGGLGDDSNGVAYVLNDLWKYSAGEWTWEGGSNLINQNGNYGILGTAAPSNVPGARQYPVNWVDGTGNLWLFGGWGSDSTGTLGLLKDLWMYSGGEWTWMGGSNLVNQSGTYGTQGMGASGNVPGAREFVLSWTDTAGNFWLFGGDGLDSTGASGVLNDLWKYSAGEWTWISGSNLMRQSGVYGTQGTAASTNVPGTRGGAAGWTDHAGNLWLFGGQGVDSNGNYGDLNDMWKYGAGQWTWMSGSNILGQTGTYGTLGIADPGNVPGARYQVVSWTAASGNFWLFGGSFYDSSLGSVVEFNDLWEYEP